MFHWVAHTLGPNTADSVPVPLLVLGGLALALMAAAGISFFARRMQARRAAEIRHPQDPPSRRCSWPEPGLESGLAATLGVTSGPVSKVQIPVGGAS